MDEVQCINDDVHRKCGTSRRGQEDNTQQQGDIRQDIHKEKIRVNILNPAMGVPITFLNKYCPNQFEVLVIACGNSWANYKDDLECLNFNENIKYGGGLGACVLDNDAKYARIIIRKKIEEETNEN